MQANNSQPNTGVTQNMKSAMNTFSPEIFSSHIPDLVDLLTFPRQLLNFLTFQVFQTSDHPEKMGYRNDCEKQKSTSLLFATFTYITELLHEQDLNQQTLSDNLKASITN